MPGEILGGFDIFCYPRIRIIAENTRVSVNIPRMTSLVEEMFHGERQPDCPVELDAVFMHEGNIFI